MRYEKVSISLKWHYSILESAMIHSKNAYLGTWHSSKNLRKKTGIIQEHILGIGRD
ncbi:MAG: hypothetical protein ACE5KT_08300 [Methanosarcinales archaeon]